MRNKDTILLEGLYTNIYNEMAFGMGAGGKQMSKEQIIDFIVHKNKNQGQKEIQISYTSITAPKVLKRQIPQHYSTLYKVTQTTGRLGNYEKIVNRELEKQGAEPDFKAQSNSRIKERLSQNIGITTSDNPVLILDVTRLSSNTSIFVVKTNTGELQEIPKEEAKTFLAGSSSSIPKEGQANYRMIGLDNIVAFRVENEEIVNSSIPEDRVQVFNYIKDKLKS
jgi:hypothetical protein